MGLHLFVLCLPTQHPKEVNHKTIDMILNEISFLLSQDFDLQNRSLSLIKTKYMQCFFFYISVYD